MVQKSAQLPTASGGEAAAPRPRGRPRAYDPAEALARATAAFWRAGYSGTSLDALSAATGMNRPSLYGAFGDKRALYLKALETYADAGEAAMDDALRPQRALPEGLRRVFELALKLYLPAGEAPRGCFLIGTAATEAVGDAEIRKLLQLALRRFDQAFERRFQLAVETGELPATAQPAVLAKLASAVLHSIALRARAGDPRSQLTALASAGIAMVCGSRA